MNLCDAAADRENLRAMMNITAHEVSEKKRRTARTHFPTHPVCRKAVHNCTKARVACWGVGTVIATQVREENTMEQPRTDQPVTSPAASEPQRSILGDLLQTLGVGQHHIDAVHQTAQAGDVNQKIDQTHQYVTDAINHAREAAQRNPAAVLGGLSALVIAAGMMRNGLKR